MYFSYVLFISLFIFIHFIFICCVLCFVCFFCVAFDENETISNYKICVFIFHFNTFSSGVFFFALFFCSIENFHAFYILIFEIEMLTSRTIFFSL